MSLSRREVLAAAVMAAPGLSIPTEAAPVSPTPFVVAIPDDRLARIRARLADAELPRLSARSGWTYEVDADWFGALLGYWRDGYDWREQETAINRLPQFTAVVRGRRLHFAHVRSPNPAARPLLMLHGWPYSFWSFSEVIGPLARDFHVVAPSLPGFAFSEPVADAPRGLRAMSEHLHALMTDHLGYPRYIVQGHDHGGVAADWLALDHADAIMGEQTNTIAFRHKGAEYGSGQTGLPDPTAAEERFVADEKATLVKETGYFALQSTRPETIAYAMADSPVGVAAYILDKWQKWTDLGSRTLEDIYGRDRLLTSAPRRLW